MVQILDLGHQIMGDNSENLHFEQVISLGLRLPVDSASTQCAA